MRWSRPSCARCAARIVVAEEMTGKLVAPIAARPPRRSPARHAPADASAIDQLSPREREILRGIARGASNKEIAASSASPRRP